VTKIRDSSGNAVQPRRGAEQELAVGYGRTGQTEFIQPIGADYLERRAGFDHVRVSVFA